MKKTLALFGAGKIGEAITAMLTTSGRYTVRVCDGDLTAAKRVADRWSGASAFQLKLHDPSSVRSLLDGTSCVISALPFSCNTAVAKAAADCDIGYADLTEDVRTSQAIAHLAENAKSWFVPQCGLAPGFISIVAYDLLLSFDVVESLKMRVGALPKYPTNRLRYNLTWSVDGLINEYCNKCEVIHNGKVEFTPALEGYERFSLDGCEYEAFNTSGGLGSLCHTLEGRVKELTYKTVRYPGHRDLITFLLDDLKFKNDRDGLKAIFERSIPYTKQDKCVILVEASGVLANSGGGARLTQRSYLSQVYNRKIAGEDFGAIQVTTAGGVCAVVDLLISGALGERRGFVKLEELPLKIFLENEFGAVFAGSV
jgi:saccharopine dehydrogenase-like NADP-dependent oxidoreductase